MHHTLRSAEIERVVEDYETIAARYGIPSIHVGRYLVDVVSSGEWSFGGETPAPALLRDTCHPLPPGNKLVTRLLTDAVNELLSTSSTPERSLPESLCANPLVGGRVISLAPEMIRGAYELKTGRVGNIEQEVTRYSLTGDSHLEIHGDFTVAGLYLVVGPASGVICARSGARTVECNLFDQWCSYERISSCILANSPEELHSPERVVTIELTDRLPDYSVCPKLEMVPPQRTLDVIGLFVV